MGKPFVETIAPHKGEAKPSEKIIKVGKKITDVALHKLGGVTSNDPEYWGLASIIDDDMADIALSMKLRHHYTLDELAKVRKCKTEEEKAHLEEMLIKMCETGFLEYDYGNCYNHDGAIEGDKTRRYCLPLFVPGSAELINMNLKRLEEHPEIGRFFERMTYIPLAGITQLVPEGGSGVGMHVIPVEKAISQCNESIDLEHISYWLKKYEGHIGASMCSCRVSRPLTEDHDGPGGCGDDFNDWCIGVGDFADYAREVGLGHDITYEEAMAIFKRAEDNGFVHQVTNIDGENKIFGICNCNVQICNALRTSQLFNTPNLSRSAYTARVIPENCVACGRCVEYCPAGAVKLGQKLKKKDGSEVKYPKMLLPDNLNWGEEKWDPEYRDNIRINCHETGTAPCKTACPAHVAVQGYIKMAKEGRYQEALALIKKQNPFPAICGRVCNKRCEAACTRGTIDDPVSIDAIKKYIAQLDLDAENRYIPPVIAPISPTSPLKSFEEKIAIIGAGPAGLTAAYYLAVGGHTAVTVFEKNERPGGMMTYGIPSYKLEKDVVASEIEVLKALGVEIKCGVEVGKDVTIAKLREEGYKAFYIAIGCQGGRRPGVPGDTALGTDIAVHFLHEATEHQDTVLNGDVVVVGGGNVAVDCARTAKRFKASNVSMFCLEDRETMPASKEEQEETLDEGIAINNCWGPKEVLTENGKVTGIVFKKCLRTIDPETKRFSPVYDENETITVKADHIVFAIGQSIEWGNLLEGTKVEFSRGNYPVADALTYQTAEDDIFVGGDVYTGPKFVVDAIAAGKIAAESLHRFVRPGAHMTIGRNRWQFKELDKEDILVEGYDTAKRVDVKVDETKDYKNSFRDFHTNLTEEEVKQEANRCLSCGASVVDENKCIGCGVCTTKCEFDAIHLLRTHPNASKMVTAENKFKYILPYAIKRAGKIVFGKKTAEEKAAQKQHKAYKKTKKAAKKAAKKAEKAA
ncbi:MAG: FAD-dependent oxidoreductase [Bacilli bacterium]|nr:FAD-dependent oxidoreductase [Bacilli bacterium]